MPTFNVKSPNGRTFIVNGPEGSTLEQAIQYAQQYLPDFDSQQRSSFAAGAGTYADPMTLDTAKGFDSDDDDEDVWNRAPVGAWVRRKDGSLEQRDASFVENIAGAAKRGVANLVEAPGRIADAVQMQRVSSMQDAADRRALIDAGAAEPGMFEGTDPGMFARFGERMGLRDKPLETTAEWQKAATDEAAAVIPGVAAREAQRSTRIDRASRETEEMRPQSVRAVDRAVGGWETFKAIAANPIDTIGNVGTESTMQFVPGLAAAIVTRNPGVAGAAAGLNSASIELANGVSDYAGKQGVDTRDEAALTTFLSDPANLDAALRYGYTRAGIIGTVDAATAGIGTKLVFPRAAIASNAGREAANIAVQTGAGMTAGAGGEAAAQYVTTGEVDMKDVVLEAAGELTQTPAEVAGYAVDRYNDNVFLDRVMEREPGKESYQSTVDRKAELTDRANRRTLARADAVEAGTMTAGAASVEDALDAARAERSIGLDAQERVQDVAAARPATPVAEAPSAPQAQPEPSPSIPEPSAPVTAEQVSQVAALQQQKAEALVRAADKTLPKEERAVARREAQLATTKIEAALAKPAMQQVEQTATSMLDQAAAGTLASATQPAAQVEPAPVAAAPAAPVAVDPIPFQPAAPAADTMPAEQTAARLDMAGLQPAPDNVVDRRAIAGALTHFGAQTADTDVQLVKVPEDMQRTADRMGRLLGRRVIFYAPKNTSTRGIDAFAGDAKRIFIDARNVANGRNPVRALIGHEFVHTLRMGNKPLFDELFAFAQPRLRRDTPYFKKLEAAYSKAYAGMRNPQSLDADIQEEALADHIGDLLNDDTFWAELAQENPSKFREIINEIIAFLDRLLTKAKTLQAPDVYAEVEAMRAKAKDILSRHMETVGQHDSLDAFDRAAAEYDEVLASETNPRAQQRGRALAQELREKRDPELLRMIQTGVASARNRQTSNDSRAKLSDGDKKIFEDDVGRTAMKQLESGDFGGAARTAQKIAQPWIPPMSIDSTEKEAFFKDVDPSLKQGGKAAVFGHGTARDITRFKPKQGEAVFGTSNPDFTAGYQGMSAHNVANDSNTDVFVDGMSMKRANDEAPEGSVEHIVAQLILKNGGDMRKAVEEGEKSDTVVMTQREPAEFAELGDLYEFDEVDERLRDYLRRSDDNKEFITTRGNTDPERAPGAGMNILPFVTNASNVFDYENKSHVKRLMENLREKYPTLASFNEQARKGQFGSKFESWSEVERALRSDGNWVTIESSAIGIPEMLREMGHDAYWVQEEGNKNIAVMDPKKVKAAYGNKLFGTREPTAEEAASLGMTLEEAIAAQQLGDIRLKLNLQQVLNATFTQNLVSQSKEMGNKLERWFLDEYRDIREVQKSVAAQVFGSVANLPKSMNVWMKENLRHGAYQDARQRAEDKYIEPITRLLGKAGVSMDEFSDYLWWRHAPERDAYLRARATPDVIQSAGADGFAGISPADARAAIAALTPERRKLFERAAKFIDAGRQYTLDTLHSSGQITDDYFNNLVAQYRHYVPLRGMPPGAEERMNARMAGGRGLSMQENPVGKRAGGRKSKPSNIIEQMMNDMDNALLGVQKQNVLASLVRLIGANPDPALWEVQPVTAQRKWVDGQLRVVQANGENQDQITFMHQGVPVKIEIRHAGMRQAMLNLHQPLPQWLRFVGRMTRWLSAVKTSFSPFFLLINPVRDAGLATMGLGAEHGMNAVRSMAAYYPHTYSALVNDQKRKPAPGTTPAQQRLHQYAREFASTGGKTGYTYVNDIREQTTKLQSMIDRNMKTPGMKDLLAGKTKGKDAALLGRKLWQNTANLFEIVNDMAENSTRLAVYAAMRDNGMGVEDAAAYAKEITVNFNRRGSIGKVLNGFYMFFNAAVQGSARLVRLHKNPKFVATMGTLMASSYALALGQMIAAGDDDDGESLYEKASGDMTNRRSIPIMLGDGRTFNIPVPYGPNIYSYTGYRLARMTYDMMKGRDVQAGQVAGDLGSHMLTSMSPIDPGKGPAALLPEIARIPVQVGMNKNDFGGKIAPKLDDRDRTGGALYHDTGADVAAGYRWLAQGLNALTGGDAYDGGFINLTGEQARYGVEQGIGGPGRLVSESIGLFQKLMSDVDVEPSDVPLANVYFKGKAPEYRTAGTYYDNVDDYENTVDDWKTAIALGDESKLEEILERAPWVSGAEADASTKEGKAAQAGTPMEARRLNKREMTALRKELDAVRTDDGLTLKEKLQAEQDIQRRMKDSQRRFNAAMNAARGTL